MKQFEVLQWAFSFLQKADREEKVAEILLQHYTNQSASSFFANMQERLSDEIVAQFKRALIEHVETGKPVQHIVGYTYFYGRKFTVNEHVLIPRFETEELVESVITFVKQTYFDRKEPITIVDIGTGSGVIAITLKLELPNVNVVATDISEAALRVAKRNATELQANITWLCGDFSQPVMDHNVNPTLIVSNPPYIRKQDRHLLSDTVKNFDPALALFAENDGLHAYETIVSQLDEWSNEQTDALFFEIGYDQGADVKQIIESYFPTSSVTIERDINGKDRIVKAKLT